jgi:hypothetical protein
VDGTILPADLRICWINDLRTHALGLYYRVPFSGFVAWFIFIGPGVAEFTHFIFPLLKPALSPNSTSLITAHVANGALIANMPNHWIGATGRYYFPGLYTAVLPMIPGLYAIYRLGFNSRERLPIGVAG